MITIIKLKLTASKSLCYKKKSNACYANLFQLNTSSTIQAISALDLPYNLFSNRFHSHGTSHAYFTVRVHARFMFIIRSFYAFSIMMPGVFIAPFRYCPERTGEKGGAMYFQQADLFGGMNKNFVKEVMNSSGKESHSKGHFVFHEDDPATYFYILIEGRVKLTIGDFGQLVHTVDHAGEAFGWSSLIDRDVYSASAECTEDTILQKFDRRRLQEILEQNTPNGHIFYKRMAGTIGHRLLNSYRTIIASSQAEIFPTTGSGQIEHSEAVS
jgi:CRP-like cAMP-binding protein